MMPVDGVEAGGDQGLDRLPDQLLAPVSEELLGLRVDERDTAVGADHDHGVGCGLEEVAKLRLGLLLRRSGLALPQAVPDRRPEPVEPVLAHVIGRALLHQGHRGLLADRARDDDQRSAGLALLHGLERRRRIECGQRIVREHYVPSALADRRAKLLERVHAPQARVEARPAELAFDQLRVVGGVLDQEHAQTFHRRLAQRDSSLGGSSFSTSQ